MNARDKAEVERQVAAAMGGKPPTAKDVIEKLMCVYGGMATRFQPGSASAPNPDAHEGKFLMWSKLAADMARLLIAFQEPRLAPVAVAPSLPAEGPRRFQLRIFGPGPGGEEFVPGTAAKVVSPAELERMSDSELTKYYRARVAAGPARHGDFPELPATTADPVPSPTETPPVVEAPAEVARSEMPVGTAPVGSEAEPEVVEVVEPEANVVPVPSDAPRPSVAEHAAALAGSRAGDQSPGGHRGNPWAGLQLPRAILRRGPHAPRISGTFDPWK